MSEVLCWTQMKRIICIMTEQFASNFHEQINGLFRNILEYIRLILENIAGLPFIAILNQSAYTFLRDRSNESDRRRISTTPSRIQTRMPRLAYARLYRHKIRVHPHSVRLIMQLLNLPEVLENSCSYQPRMKMYLPGYYERLSTRFQWNTKQYLV